MSQQKATIANGEYQVAIDAFCADSDDAKPLLLPYLSKSRSPRNMTRNSNPELDAVYDKFKSATDEKERDGAGGRDADARSSPTPTACR